MNIFETLSHYLIPRTSNNHKAKLLHPGSLFVVTVLLIGFQTLVILTPRYQSLSGVLGYAANISVDQVILLTNQKRAENGLPPLKYNKALAMAAQAKGEYMIEKDFWAHVAPDGTQPWKFFRDVGYKYRYAGENLARDFPDASSAVDAWMASPTHKDNLLSGNYSETGVAVVEGDLGGVDTTIIVQLFGRRLSEATASAGEEEVAPPVAEVSQEQKTDEVTILPIAKASGPETKAQQIKVSPFNINKSVSIGVIGLLFLIFMIDLLVVSRKRIIRISGRNFAHIAFLGMILVILIIARAGQIL